MSQNAGEFSIQLEHSGGYEFRVSFDKAGYQPLLTDEPAPLGKDEGPNPARLLAAAIGNCLAASLVFCLTRAGNPGVRVNATARVQLVRNERRRLRVGGVTVTLRPEGASDEALKTCLSTFEDFCIVTQSVREGLSVTVDVENQTPETNG